MALLHKGVRVCDMDGFWGSAGSPELSKAERQDLEKQLRAREDHLLPIFHQVAVRFADLHDTPGRMQEKGTITVKEFSVLSRPLLSPRHPNGFPTLPTPTAEASALHRLG